jgi:hypothetical protein
MMLFTILLVAQSARPVPRSHAPIHAMLVAVAVSQVADAVTTHAALSRSGAGEANPFYGPHPSLSRVLLTKTALFVPVSLVLDASYRRHPKVSLVAAGVLTAVGTAAALHNSRIR